jgi:hypothetical protein
MYVPVTTSTEGGSFSLFRQRSEVIVTGLLAATNPFFFFLVHL